ncbi:MAG: hypothetical protein A2Y21_10400 [Clostridiales bacterium GWC2_40_7]|nr:MAG: hypothetical protein A2Y21_10400 [Clostridiales bacterium GWC2_40_7]
MLVSLVCSGKVILCECKWKNQFYIRAELNDLIKNTEVAAPSFVEKHYILFSKVPFSDDSKALAKKIGNVELVIWKSCLIFFKFEGIA